MQPVMPEVRPRTERPQTAEVIWRHVMPSILAKGQPCSLEIFFFAVGGKAELVSSTSAVEVYSCLGVRCCAITKARPLQKHLFLPHPPSGS